MANRMQKLVADALAHNGWTQREQLNDRGNQTIDMFWDHERYHVDFADDFKEEGWEQFDTDQDAHYFGVWVNKSKLMTLTYAEGDWTLRVCKDKDTYNKEIEDCIKFYDEGSICTTIGDEGVTVYTQNRQQFLIK